MAWLFLTRKEKKDKSFLSWSNESLGKLVRKVAFDIKHSNEKDGIIDTTVYILLAHKLHKLNARNLTYKFTLEDKEKGELGDFEITVTKVR